MSSVLAPSRLGSIAIGKLAFSLLTVADLRAINTGNDGNGVPLLEHGSTAEVQGYISPTDQSGGTFRFNAYSSAAHNGGRVIAPLDGLGRWEKLNDGPVTASEFGAVGNGVTDDTAALQAAIDFCAGSGGGSVILDRAYRVNTSLEVKLGVTLTGGLSIRDARDANTLESLVGRVVLAPTATIAMREASTLHGLIIVPAGMDFPQSAAAVATWTGTAITIKAQAHGVTIQDCCIVGWGRCIDGEATAYTEQTRITRCALDGLNGVRVLGGSDIVYLDEVNCWPTGSVGLPGAAAADLVRSGIAFELDGTAQRIDAPNLSRCFAYGYATGYKLEKINAARVIGCVADYPDTAGDRTGFAVTGDSISTYFLSCHAWRQKYGWDLNLAQNVHAVSLDACNAEFSTAAGLRSSRGTVAIGAGSIFRGAAGAQTPIGIEAHDTPAGSVIMAANCLFDFCTVAAAETGTTPGACLHLTQCVHSGNGANVVTSGPAIVAAAAALAVPAHTTIALVQSGADIKSILSPGTPGKRLTLIFSDAQTVVHGAAIKLQGAANFVASADDVLELMWTGTAWYECGRVVI